MKFVTLEEIILIHESMIFIGGGRMPIHDFTLLHSALERPKAQFGGRYLYPTLWLMAGALMQSLVKNHPFDDGNKRTAYATTAAFLYKNGYKLIDAKEEAVTFMVSVDTQNTSVEDIAVWLESHSDKVS